MENTGFPDDKYKRMWAWTTIFTGISLALNLGNMLISSNYFEFNLNDQGFTELIKIHYLGLHFSFLFNLLSLIAVCLLFLNYKTNKIVTNSVVIILMSFPVLEVGFFNMALVLSDIGGIYSGPCIQGLFCDFPLYSQNSHILQYFFILFFIFLLINLFLLLRISPYQSSIFRKIDWEGNYSIRRLKMETRRFITRHYHYLYITTFIALSHILTMQLLNKLTSGEILFFSLVVFPIISVYVGFVTGFAMDTQANARLMSIILGALGSVIYFILSGFKLDTTSTEYITIILALVVFLVLGSLISRDMGMVGYRAKAG